MDAGFLQYFMTQNTGDLKEFHPVTCREYTLPRDDETSQPRGWIQGHIKNGSLLEVTTSYLHGKHGVSIRTVFLNREIILTRESEFLMGQINLWWIWITTTLQFLNISSTIKRYNWMHNILWNWTKAKAKPQRRDSADFSTRIVHMDKKNLIDIESGKYSLCTKFGRKLIIFFITQ